jgi:hypothetical protein
MTFIEKFISKVGVLNTNVVVVAIAKEEGEEGEVGFEKRAYTTNGAYTTTRGN